MTWFSYCPAGKFEMRRLLEIIPLVRLRGTKLNGFGSTLSQKKPLTSFNTFLCP